MTSHQFKIFFNGRSLCLSRAREKKFTEKKADILKRLDRFSVVPIFVLGLQVEPGQLHVG
jgi:hypothetical protein